jgi:hypothetical protein
MDTIGGLIRYYSRSARDEHRLSTLRRLREWYEMAAGHMDDGAPPPIDSPATDTPATATLHTSSSSVFPPGRAYYSRPGSTVLHSIQQLQRQYCNIFLHSHMETLDMLKPNLALDSLNREVALQPDPVPWGYQYHPARKA